MKLVIASNNAHKIQEIKQILGDCFETVLSMREAGIDMDIDENGETFSENAQIKAAALADVLSDCAVLADDSGLMIDALDGRPGVYSARYAGVHGDDDANNDLVLEQMASVPDSERTGRFCCSIALLRPGQDPIVTEGFIEGRILHERRGTGGFGYDPLFFIPEAGKTMAELTPEEKNAISHRSRALAALKQVLKGSEA